MNNKNAILAFELTGEYGHFRKFNTTTSPLTYSIPTKTAISGMLGAILGIQREGGDGKVPDETKRLSELFRPDRTRIAIQILNPIKKVSIGFNLLDTGKAASTFFNITNRTQIEFELLKEPKYRIFFNHSDIALQEEISSRIKNVDHHFTPYLGLSQFTASLRWAKEFEWKTASSNEEYVSIQSAVNVSRLRKNDPILFEQFYYSSDTMPIYLNKNRIVKEYAEVLIERNGKAIRVNTEEYLITPFGNALFL